jgi:hypothetical protein
MCLCVSCHSRWVERYAFGRVLLCTPDGVQFETVEPRPPRLPDRPERFGLEKFLHSHPDFTDRRCAALDLYFVDVCSCTTRFRVVAVFDVTCCFTIATTGRRSICVQSRCFPSFPGAQALHCRHYWE